LGWGSTYAAITAGVKRVRKAGKSVAQLHLVHLNPFAPNLGEVLRSYEVILVPEGNLGHLRTRLRASTCCASDIRVAGDRSGSVRLALLDECPVAPAVRGPEGAPDLCRRIALLVPHRPWNEVGFVTDRAQKVRTRLPEVALPGRGITS